MIPRHPRSLARTGEITHWIRGLRLAMASRPSVCEMECLRAAVSSPHRIRARLACAWAAWTASRSAARRRRPQASGLEVHAVSRGQELSLGSHRLKPHHHLRTSDPAVCRALPPAFPWPASAPRPVTSLPVCLCLGWPKRAAGSDPSLHHVFWLPLPAPAPTVVE